MNYNVDMMNLLKLTNLLNPLNLISMGNTTISITIRMGNMTACMTVCKGICHWEIRPRDREKGRRRAALLNPYSHFREAFFISAYSASYSASLSLAFAARFSLPSASNFAMEAFVLLMPSVTRYLRRFAM